MTKSMRNEEFSAMMAEAEAMVDKMDQLDRAAGIAPRIECALMIQLSAIRDALRSGVVTKNWLFICEGIVRIDRALKQAKNEA